MNQLDKKQLEENKYWIAKLTNEGLAEIETQTEDSNRKLGEAQSRIEDIQREVFNEPKLTVKSTLQSLYNLSTATDIQDAETGETVSLDDLQTLVFQDVEVLADLLGIELADWSPAAKNKLDDDISK